MSISYDILQEDNTDMRPLNLERSQCARESFAEYSAIERQRKQDSGTDFNSQIFDEAVKIVIRKLQRLEDEGKA